MRMISRSHLDLDVGFRDPERWFYNAAVTAGGSTHPGCEEPDEVRTVPDQHPNLALVANANPNRLQRIHRFLCLRPDVEKAEVHGRSKADA